MSSAQNRRIVFGLLTMAMTLSFLGLTFVQPVRSAPDDGRRLLTGSRSKPRGILEDLEEPQVHLLRCDQEIVEVELLTPTFDSAIEMVEGKEYHRLSFPGAGFTTEQGAPQLPVRTLTLGIPLEVEVRGEVVLAETERFSGIQVYPVPRRLLRQHPTGEPYTDEEFYQDDGRYGRNAVYPARAVEVVATAFIRDQRVAQVEVRPLQVNPATGELLFHRRLVFRLTFQGGAKGDWWKDEPLAVVTSDGPFEVVLKNILANYEPAKNWRRGRSYFTTPKSTGTETPYGDSTAYKIILSEDGLYSMSYEYLKGQGVNVTHIDPKTVKIYTAGHQIPIYVSGARDGRFDPGDVIQFWGELNYGDEHYFDPYTHANVYWLTWGGDIGMRMVEQDGSLMEENPDSLIVPRSYRTTLHMEQDLNYERLSQISDESVDRWLWDEFTADTTRSYSFNLTAVDDSADCEVEVRLRGLTFPIWEPNHHVKITLNGQFLGTLYWSDQDEGVYHRSDVPGTNVWEGENILRIQSIADTQPEGQDPLDKIRLNWFQIDYSRGYQAESNYLSFATPENGELGLYEFRLTGFTTPDVQIFDLAGKKIVNFDVSPDSIFYTVKFQDRVVRPVQYVALSRSLMKLPDEIIPNRASNLHDLSNGTDYILIVHSDFYDSVLPLALHRQSHGLRVKVVRVEDIYDEFNDGVMSPVAIREFLRYAYQNWIAPSPAYVLLVGDTSWGYDKPITHKPYWREHCWVPTMMAWTSAWGTSSADSRLVCLVGGDRLPDMAIGRFPVSSAEKADIVVNKIIQYEANPEIGPWRKRIQLLAGEGVTFERGCVELDSAFVPPGYDAPRIYTKSGSTHFGTTQDLLDQWNEGVAMATFSGHGGGSVWFDANFFLLSHVEFLENGQRLPVVLSLTCFVGYFDNPQQSSLGEEILRAEDKGAVAHFGSSGVAWANEDNLLGQNIFQAIFEDGQRNIGIAFTQGKLGLRRISQELVDVFNLLGDPATRIGLPNEEISLNLTEQSLPMGETISLAGNVPGGQGGTVEVSFGDVDTTGWGVDATVLNMTDKIHAPRLPVAQQTLSVSGGVFNWQTTPPDTLAEYPTYQLTSGKKAARAYFWNNQSDAIGWAPVYLDIPYVHDIHQQPEKPRPWEDVHIFADVELGAGLDPDGPDTVKVRWGLREEMLYNYIPMVLQSGHTYRTVEPFAAQGGATIWYQVIIRYGGQGGSSSTRSYSCPVYFFQVSRIPNLWVSKKDISAFVQNDQFCFSSWIHSTAVVDLDSVLVRYYDDHPDSGRQIGTDLRVTIVAEDSTFVSIPWEAPGEPHDIYVWLDPEHEVEQAPTYDDRAHRLFSNLFLVTPGGGTLVNGTNARVYHVGGNMACQINPGSVNRGSLLFVDDQGSDSAYYAETYHPAGLNQPGLSFAPLQDSSYGAYHLVWEDSAVSMNSTGLHVHFWYHAQDSAANLAVQMDQLKICRFTEGLNRWVLVPQQEVVAESSMAQAHTGQLGIFGLFILQDLKPPMVRINVEGQAFTNGDYISSNPIISAAIEDENGVDITTPAMLVTLNGNPVASSDYAVYYSPATSNFSLLTFAPDLSPGPYDFKVTAQDCFGNTASDSISFNITAGFQIPFVANHPNPFQSETIFAFVVASDAPADQVTLKIYTVRGHLIREFIRRSVGPGYAEIVWDGRDSDGEPVANGVYYYKMSVTSGSGEKISPIVGKIAKLE